MSEEKWKLITRIELGETEDGKSVVGMYEDNPKLRFPSLRLFDLSQLFTVGIDPNELEKSEECFVRFFAYYTESDRTNQAGNKYLDVTHLEPVKVERHSEVGNKLDTIAALLQSIDQRLASIDQLTEIAASAIVRLANAKQEPLGPGGVPIGPDDWPGDDEPEPEPVEDPRQGKEAPGSAPQPAAEPEELAAKSEGHDGPILDEDMARRKFGRIAGSGVRDGTIDRALPGQLTSRVSAGAMNWRTALQQLEAMIGQEDGS